MGASYITTVQGVGGLFELRESIITTRPISHENPLGLGPFLFWTHRKDAKVAKIPTQTLSVLGVFGVSPNNTSFTFTQTFTFTKAPEEG